jgi:hypothetical protein
MSQSHAGLPEPALSLLKGLAFESGQAKNAGCPTLAASLFLRLGWDAKKLNRFSLAHPNGASAA